MSTTSSKNFTTLYSGAGSVVPQGAYGNANVVSLLSVGTDGANTVGNITATGAITGSALSVSGNVTAANVTAGTVTGNLVGGAVTATTISATGNITTDGYFVGNFAGNITGNLTVPGSNTQVLFNNNGNAGASADFTFNDATNLLSVTGNVQANYFLGNGSQLTGLPATYGNANVTTLLAALGSNTISSTGNITTTANVSGGFILGNGSQLTGLPATYSNANVTSLMAAFGSNTISSTGNITTTANVSGGFFLGNGSQLTGLPATYGNANVAANLAAFATNPISTSGNITAGFFLGNGSQLTGLPATYSDANVTTLLAALGSNVISSTGNITTSANVAGAFFLGNGSQLTGITANLSGNLSGNLEGNTFGANAFAFVSATGNISSNQQTIIGTANATASATGNIVVSGKNIATDVVFVPDASTTTAATGGRVLVGTGIAGNTSIAAWDPSNILRGPRVAIMDSYTKNNASVVSGALATYAAVSLDGNITAAGSRVHGITSFVNVSGGAAGNTYLTSGGGAVNNGLNALSGVLNLGGSNSNLVTQIGANITTRYATATSGLLQFYGNGTVVGNGYGHISSIFNQATGNISVANVAFYGASPLDIVTTTATVGNTIGYLFPDHASGQFGLGTIGSSFQRGNLYAFMNAGNLAQVRLGSTIEQHYYAYPIPTTTGNVTINAVNGQVQTVTPTGAMAITDVTNLITGALNTPLGTTIPQSQSVTVQIRQGATGYAVTLPTTLGGNPVSYADGFNTVSTTAFSSTFVTFYQVPNGVSGGAPFYCEVKTSDAGGGAAGNDGLIQFNSGGASLTGGRLAATGNLFWSNSTQTLQTQNCNVVADLNALGNINGGNLSTSGTVSAAGNVNISGQGINFAGAGIINASNHIAYAGAALALGSFNTGNTLGNATITADGAAGTVEIAGGGTQTWNFSGATGNLTLPGNTSAINYANGVNILTSATGTYGNANVATFMAGFGSNTISTTGNITSGNIATTGISTLGSLKTYSEAQYTLATSGTVNIDKNNAQVQYLAPTANVTIGSFSNFVTTQSGQNQADTVTLIIKQGATPYTITMPTGNAAIKYAGNVTTVGTTANSVTMASISAANVGGAALYLVTVSPEFV